MSPEQPLDRTRTLTSKVALITGGSAGIGLATARLFAQHGAKVAILARRKQLLDKAREEIDACGGPGACLPIVCDATKEPDVQAAFKSTLEKFGRLDIVVNNAGYGVSAPVEETTLRDLEDMLAIHVVASFLVAREAVKIMKNNPAGGSIVFVSSDSAVKAGKRAIAYNPPKAAQLHMARCLAEECGQYHIRVNSVLPGAVFGISQFWTPEYRRSRAAAYGFDPNKLEIEYEKNVALKVTILPEEVAEAILFFASDLSNKITGASMGIDGGGASAYVR